MACKGVAHRSQTGMVPFSKPGSPKPQGDRVLREGVLALKSRGCIQTFNRNVSHIALERRCRDLCDREGQKNWNNLKPTLAAKSNLVG